MGCNQEMSWTMTAESGRDNHLPPPVQDFQPTTFLERGIAVPFTTPMLVGTRARPGDRAPMELIVPNPSGGKGVYILAWDDIPALCRPTVHDVRLTAIIASTHGVSPMTIRRAARAAAGEGYAGRSAAAAARAAEARDKQSVLTVNFELLLGLVRDVESRSGAVAVATAAADVEKRAKRAIARIAPELGRTPESIATTLEELATLFAGVGVGSTAATARAPSLLARLEKLRADLRRFTIDYPGDQAQEADLVAGAIDLTATCTAAVLGEAHAAAFDTPALIRRWLIEPEPLAQLLARPEWLLDGWDHIAGLWESAPAHLGYANTLPEMCNLIPVIPREIGTWVGHQINIDTELQRHRRKVTMLEDWRTGKNVVDIVRRNEAVLEAAV